MRRGTGHGDDDNDAGSGTTYSSGRYIPTFDKQQRLNIHTRKATFCAKHRLSLNTTQAARCRRNACAELRTRFSSRLQIWRRERAEDSCAHGEGEEQSGIWTCWRSERWIRVAKTVIRDSNFFGASGGEKERERLCDGHAKTSA